MNERSDLIGRVRWGTLSFASALPSSPKQLLVAMEIVRGPDTLQLCGLSGAIVCVISNGLHM